MPFKKTNSSSFLTLLLRSNSPFLHLAHKSHNSPAQVKMATGYGRASLEFGSFQCGTWTIDLVYIHCHYTTPRSSYDSISLDVFDDEEKEALIPSLVETADSDAAHS